MLVERLSEKLLFHHWTKWRHSYWQPSITVFIIRLTLGWPSSFSDIKHFGGVITHKKSISYLLMAWQLILPGHQQAWYWFSGPCCLSHFCCSISHLYIYLEVYIIKMIMMKYTQLFFSGAESNKFQVNYPYDDCWCPGSLLYATIHKEWIFLVLKPEYCRLTR